MEQWQESIRNASTAFYSANGDTPGLSRSQVTINFEARSQVTVSGLARSEILSQEALSGEKGGRNTNKEDTTPPQYGGLEKDGEGVETRKEMLARRRKECAVEEVDVALAPVMKINVPYVFYPEQYKRFRAMFPRVNVDSGLSYTHHDHPVAHTATLVGTRRLQGMLQPGEIALDLFGNPNGNEQFNRFQSSRLRKRPALPRPPIIETLVQENTAMDAVRRVTKWGKEFDENHVRRYHNISVADITPGMYNTFIMVNSLYYMSMYEVNSLLAKNPKSKIIALVNYSKEPMGKLYGELQFTKQGGITTQYSPNGESYQHPDIDQWFQTSSFRTFTERLGCGIAWTSVNIGGPLYILTITSCRWASARTHRYEPPEAPTLKVSAGRSFFGLVRIGGIDVRLNITNVDLAAELRHWMVFRDRNNPQTFLDLCVKARRITSKDLVDGARQYEVGDGQLQDHITYSYLVDAPGELELMEGIKLLRGDLLAPLAEALKLQGKDNVDSLVQALFSWMLGRKKPDPALLSRSTVRSTSKTNTGGLLPATRA